MCMTVYNGQQFLREAIDSVLMQQGAQIHFCIVDDASADGSAQLLSAYAEQYPNIVRVLTNPHNQGIGRSLSRALRCYQGEAYFAMIGQDDRWGPNFLCSQMDYLNEQKAVASFADVKLIDSLGTVIESGFVRFQHKRLQELGQQELLLALIQNNFLCAASAVVSMARAGSDISLWELFGICNDRLQDCECWLNLCLRGRFVYHRRTHVDYRVHCSNFSRPEKRWLQVKLEQYGMLERVLSSKSFWSYICSSGEPACVLAHVVQIVKEKSEECNPCRLLVVKLCETALTYGIETPELSDLLAKSYQDFGLLEKSYRMSQEVPKPIPIAFPDAVDAAEFRRYLGKMTLFYLVAANTPGALQAALWPPARGTAPEATIVFILPHGNETEAKAVYPKALLQHIEAIDVPCVLAFVEDKTAVFRNGILEGYPANNDIVNYYQDILCGGIILNSKIFQFSRRLVALLRQHRIRKTL